MASFANTASLPTDNTVKVSSWLFILLIALAIHAIAFIIYGLESTQTQGAKNEGLQGIEIGFKEIILPKKQQPAPVVTENLEEKPIIKEIVKKKKIEKKPLPKNPKILKKPIIEKSKAVAIKPAINNTVTKQETTSTPINEVDNTAESTEDLSTTSVDKTAIEETTNTSNNSEAEKLASKSKNSLGGGNPKVQISYRQLLLQQLERHKRYPNSAMRRGQEGVINLEFIIDQNGNVLSYKLLSPSKHKSLNKAVERMIKKANPLPKIPSPINTGALEYRFIVPIKFEL